MAIVSHVETAIIQVSNWNLIHHTYSHVDCIVNI